MERGAVYRQWKRGTGTEWYQDRFPTSDTGSPSLTTDGGHRQKEKKDFIFFRVETRPVHRRVHF